MNKKLVKISLIGTAVTAIAGLVVYKVLKKDKDEQVTQEMFTQDIDEFFDFWEAESIRTICKQIKDETGDTGPFTVDLQLSNVDDDDETDDYVIVHSESKTDYKLFLSKTINQCTYTVM